MELIPLSLKEANEFVLSYHRHNKPTVGGKFAIGVIDNQRLVGVAIVGRPIARKLSDGVTAEVTRVCTNDDAPMGACSKLYSACWKAWKAMGGKKLVTYTLATERGSSVKGAGFRAVAESKPKKNGWNSESRQREWQPVYGQLKFRWEITSKNKDAQ